MSPLLHHAWTLQKRIEFLAITQAELVKRLRDQGCDVTPAAVSRWVSGRSFPSRELLPKLIAALEFSKDEKETYIRTWAGLG